MLRDDAVWRLSSRCGICIFRFGFVMVGLSTDISPSIDDAQYLARGLVFP